MTLENGSLEIELAAPEARVFHAGIKRKSSNADGSMVIEGWASTGTIDRDGEIIDPAAFQEGINGWLKHPVIRYMHERFPIGRGVSATINAEAGFWIKALISAADDVKDIRTKIDEGILSAFSVGFRVLDKGVDIVGGIPVIRKIDLYEVSVVDIPANIECGFSIAKAARYGTDLFVPMTRLVTDLEELKAKFAALSAAAAVTIQPEPIPEVKAPGSEYEPFLRELAATENEIEAERARGAFRSAIDKVRKEGDIEWPMKSRYFR